MAKKKKAMKCAKGGCVRMAAGGGAYCSMHRDQAPNVKK